MLCDRLKIRNVFAREDNGCCKETYFEEHKNIQDWYKNVPNMFMYSFYVPKV